MINKVIVLKEKLQDYPNLIMATINKGTILKNSKQFKEADETYDLAEKYIVDHNLTEDHARLMYQRAVLYITDGYLKIEKAYEQLKLSIPLFVAQEKWHYEGCSRILLGQLYEAELKGIILKIKEIGLEDDLDWNNTLLSLDQPLKVDFNKTSLNLTNKEIENKLQKLYVDCENSNVPKTQALLNIAVFMQHLANDELVKGLTLVKKTNLDYYGIVLSRYS